MVALNNKSGRNSSSLATGAVNHIIIILLLLSGAARGKSLLESWGDLLQNHMSSRHIVIVHAQEV